MHPITACIFVMHLTSAIGWTMRGHFRVRDWLISCFFYTLIQKNEISRTSNCGHEELGMTLIQCQVIYFDWQIDVIPFFLSIFEKCNFFNHRAGDGSCCTINACLNCDKNKGWPNPTEDGKTTYEKILMTRPGTIEYKGMKIGL